MTTDHPAPYSPQIIEVFRQLIPAGCHVHDPYAGEGLRLGALCDDLGVTFSGTDLEPVFIRDPRVKAGDATQRRSYPRGRYVIVTSPVYPNGIADDWHAQDGSRRRTYRSAAAKLRGHDEPMHPNNMGRWGYRGTKLGNPKRIMYWKLARETIECWTRADLALVNVSDFLHSKGTREYVTNGWVKLLESYGWSVRKVLDVETPRWRDGANGAARVEAEQVIVALPAGS